MKTLKLVSVSFLMISFVLLSSSVKSQSKTGPQQVKIKTSAMCGMCKDRIETALAYEKGIKKSDLDVKSKILTVTYNPEKTNVEKIRQLVSKVGYDADEVAADPKAYEALPPCCKKDAKPH